MRRRAVAAGDVHGRLGGGHQRQPRCGGLLRLQPVGRRPRTVSVSYPQGLGCRPSDGVHREEQRHVGIRDGASEASRPVAVRCPLRSPTAICYRQGRNLGDSMHRCGAGQYGGGRAAIAGSRQRLSSVLEPGYGQHSPVGSQFRNGGAPAGRPSFLGQYLVSRRACA